jgi:hypothetical protein
VLRVRHNELVGWQVNVLGTIYAIILGFMLYTTWDGLQAAKQNAGAEATALVNVARLGHGLDRQNDLALTALSREYANVVIQKEWPAMQHAQFVPESHIKLEAMWNLLANVHPETPAQQIALGAALNEMTSLTDHRRTRRIEMSDRLPAILWVVLDSGGALLLFCCCLFGSHEVRLHLFLVSALAFLLTLLLLTVAAVDRPFQGWLRVPVESFQGAATTLNAE